MSDSDGDWGEGPNYTNWVAWMILAAAIIGPIIGLLNGHGLYVFAPHATYGLLAFVVWVIDRRTTK